MPNLSGFFPAAAPTPLLTPGLHAPQGLASAVRRGLRASGYLSLREVVCDLRAGVLVLRGSLPSYHLKQVAQEVAARVEGVYRISNQIEVSVARKSAEAGERSSLLLAAAIDGQA